MEFQKAIDEARKSKKRKFKQSFELILSLTGIDTKTFSLNDVFELPHGRGKQVKICVVASGDSLVKAKSCADLILDKDSMGEYVDKKKSRKLAEQMAFFVVEAPLMANFAKLVGVVLGPRGKMPLPYHIVPPGGDPCPLVKKLRNSVRLRARKNPVLHTLFGTEDMEDEKLVENVSALYEHIVLKLEKGELNIEKVFVKLSMGKPVIVDG
ncbi:MAG: 50S ribosomal protein L1 [Candidatus Altiarchaeota archaeon]|nr:50S ribosomal protein L1 [Candidatus Altiarchaeota archaeon]